MKSPNAYKRILFFLVLFISLFHSCNDCRQIEVPYEVEEPYEVNKEQTINLSYKVDGSTWDRKDGATLLGLKPKVWAHSNITNTSDYNGEFRIGYTFKSNVNGEFTIYKSEFLRSGESKMFELEKDLAYYESVDFVTFDIIAPQKTVVNTLVKYRTVTRYRTCNSCDEDCK